MTHQVCEQIIQTRASQISCAYKSRKYFNTIQREIENFLRIPSGNNGYKRDSLINAKISGQNFKQKWGICTPLKYFLQKYLLTVKA